MKQLNDELRYRVLKTLERDSNISQRALAKELGVSLGKANYCLQALVEKGLVKIDNFKHSRNKLGYAYLLTPRGLEEKGRVTVRFFRRKMQEYEELELELEELRRELGSKDATSE